jgi:hypothetical protein
MRENKMSSTMMKGHMNKCSYQLRSQKKPTTIISSCWIVPEIKLGDDYQVKA